jgi:hypothetical protein
LISKRYFSHPGGCLGALPATLNLVQFSIKVVGSMFFFAKLVPEKELRALTL